MASLLPLTYDLITKVNTTIQVMNLVMEPYGNTGIRGTTVADIFYSHTMAPIEHTYLSHCYKNAHGDV